jgi:PAS domain S-box-containing protein
VTVDDEEMHARLARAEAEVERLRRREQHFTEAQRISHVGSYDFDIASNTNDWSDQLYRIYGREPQSFNATYEKFLEMVHPDDRDTIVGVHQQAMATMSPYQMEERIVWPDGQVRTLASWGEVVPDENGQPGRMVGICWDITEQKANQAALERSEELALRLHDTEVRRRHALEINDNVVQGLASVLYLMDLERYPSAHAAARQTLASARAMMSGLLTETEETLVPGQLIREQGHVGTLHDMVPPSTPAPEGALRVLLVDDAADIRLLLRFALAAESGYDVVGEAANGLEAVELATQLQPDVVVLDLSMPVMDGLQAIPELLRVCPEGRIVVLSGFDEARMKQVALDLGAHGYVEKGAATAELVAVLTGLFPTHGLGRAVTAPPDPDSAGGLAFDGDMVVHELRTPLTVITGMLATLRDRMDVLPATTTAELIGAALRNAGHMTELLQAVSDARRASHGELSVAPEPTDVGALVRSAVSDLCAGHGWRPAEVTAPTDVIADVDPVRLRQVLANLLSNAYRYAPPGSPVRVTVAAGDGQVEVCVSDDGPGVPAQRRGELFRKFSRLDSDGAGMGLGLFISRAIARAHGGDLTLVDRDGATFALSLPRAARAPQHA